MTSTVKEASQCHKRLQIIIAWLPITTRLRHTTTGEPQNTTRAARMKAAHHAHTAYGHQIHAAHHAGEAAKTHTAAHGKK